VFSLFLLSSKHAKSFSDSSGKQAMFTEAALLRMSRLLFAAKRLCNQMRMSRLLFVGSYLQFLRPIKNDGMIFNIQYMLLGNNYGTFIK
jgi:hypothetical protein